MFPGRQEVPKTLIFAKTDSHADDIIQAVRDVHEGKSALDPVIARKLIAQLAGRAENKPPETLTPRETDVLKLIANGLSNSQIASELVISENTVKGHVSNILSKLQLENRTQAVLYALREGLVTLEE